MLTEGEKTEVDYFEALRRAHTSSLVEIEIVGGVGVPMSIARRASDISRRLRREAKSDSFMARDEVWAVFDRDAHPHIPDAFEICRVSKVEVAFSDPCFEVWMILHICDYDQPDHRHDVQKKLESICPEYDRTHRKTADCNKLVQNVLSAEQRAEKQFEARKAEGEPPGPPFTTVFRLTRKFRDSKA